ncbi:MAG: 6-carboxytetrahydropterin synthase QueD [Deltaproteobacteria bacterium]|nr:MAG: 6-carboxytetrahydropterin synthase QueD [Deltaproteobacteria bacterium]
MYEVSVQMTFSAAHRLRGYQGRCENLHGHNYRVEVVAAAEKLDDCGLAVDFGVLKQLLGQVLDRFDHADLNELEEFARVNPSAENIARVIFEGLAAVWPLERARLASVSVWESEASRATYHE